MKTPNNDSLGGLLDLKVSLIDRDPNNRQPDEAGLPGLADSIKTEGLLQPIVVKLHPTKPGRYMLVAGERRWLAFQLNKSETIPARLLKAGTDEASAARKRAAENLQREDLSPIQEAVMFRELIEVHKMSQADVAKLAGKKNPSYVSNSLRLLPLMADIQKKLETGELSRAHGVALARYARWPKVCTCLAELVLDEDVKMSSKELEQGISYDASRVLKDEKLGAEISEYDFPNSKIPAEILKDPDVLEIDGEVWCFNMARYQAFMKPVRDAQRAENEKRQQQHRAATQTDKGEVIEKEFEYLAVLLPKEKVGKRGGKLVCLDSARWRQIDQARREVSEKDELKVLTAAATEARALVVKAKTLSAAMVAVLFADQDLEFNDVPGIDSLVGKEAKALGIKCPKWSYAAAVKLDATQLIKLQILARLDHIIDGTACDWGCQVDDVVLMLSALLGREKLGFQDETPAGRAQIIERLCEKLKIPKLMLPPGALPAPAKKGGAK